MIRSKEKLVQTAYFVVSAGYEYYDVQHRVNLSLAQI